MSEGFPITLGTARKLQADHTRLKHIRHDMPTLATADQAGNQNYNHGQLPAPILAIAKANIDHNAVGEVKIAELAGPPVSSGDTPEPTAIDPELLRNVANYLCPRIWMNSPLLIEYCTVPKSGGVWIVTKAWSATRLRGQIVGALSSGDSTKTMDNLIELDGHYEVASAATTLTFSNVFGDSAADNAVGIVEWNDENEQWELTAVVCT